MLLAHTTTTRVLRPLYNIVTRNQAAIRTAVTRGGAKNTPPLVEIQVKSKLDALDQQILSWQCEGGLLWLPASVPARAET